jgi:hypothetical protein
MPEPLPITFINGVPPDDYCPESHAALVTYILSLIEAEVPGPYTIWNFGSTVPLVADQDRPWMRLDAEGRPDGPYVFYNSQWVRKHPVPHGPNGVRQIWTGTPDELKTFDGGEDATVGDSTGPFWEIDTDFAARIPMGVGTTAGGQAIDIATSYGADEVTLAAGQLPEHFHYMAVGTANGAAGPLLSAAHSLSYSGGGMGSENYNLLGLDVTTNVPNVGQTSKAGSATPTEVSILPPVRGVYFIKRTARRFYLAT